MDGFTADNPENNTLINSFQSDVEFLQVGDSNDQLDPHTVIEMRITELWKKLEETTDNLNSCDYILETYFKTVAEKMKENRCPNCLKEASMKETTYIDPDERAASIYGNPKALIEEISSSLLNVEKTIIYDSNLNIELTVEEGTINQNKANGEAMCSNNELCKTLQEILLKLKNLEAKLMKPQRIELLKKCEENEAKEGDRVDNLAICGADDEQNVPKEETGSLVLKDDSEISFVVMSCVILSLAASVLSTEIKENEKQQKRGIFGLGYGSNLGSYGIGLGNTGVLYSGLSHSDLGISGLGYSSLGLSGIGYGRSYGYAAAAPFTVATAPLTVATAPLAISPVARTVVASAPFLSRVAFPVHAHVSATPITAHVTTPLRAHVSAPLAVATPITAHVTAAPVHAHIAAPLTAHAPVAAITHVATPVTHHVAAAPVHITQPITARITAPLAAPITSVNLAYGGRLGHGRALLH